MIAGGVGHFKGDVGGEGAHGCEKAIGDLDDVAADHQNGHGFADGASAGEHESGENAGLGGRQDNLGNSGPAGEAEGLCALEIGGGNFGKAGIGSQGDGRNDHERQDEDSGQETGAWGVNLTNERHQNHESPESVDHRWNSGQ